MVLAKLLPQDAKFHVYLERLANLGQKSSTLLNEIVKSKNIESANKKGEELVEAKREARDLMNNFTTDLCRTFITPFDREDLQGLAALIYKIINRTNKIRIRATVPNIYPHRKNFSEMTQLIVEQSEALSKLVHQLNRRNMTEIRKGTAIINDLEDKCDEVLASNIVKLFSDAPDLHATLIIKDNFEALEKTTDLYRDAGNLILQTIMKHS